MKQTLLLLACLLLQAPSYAKHASNHPLSPEDWGEVQQRIELLNDAVFIPSLLPVVMRNRDALGLTEEQLAALDQWRRENYVPMVNLMNRIIELKVQFSVEALSTSVTSEHLLAFQSQIHQLQHELLMIRLSCRETLINTFTPEQWENFEFIAADNHKLASFISLSKSIEPRHSH